MSSSKTKRAVWKKNEEQVILNAMKQLLQNELALKHDEELRVCSELNRKCGTQYTVKQVSQKINGMGEKFENIEDNKTRESLLKSLGEDRYNNLVDVFSNMPLQKRSRLKSHTNAADVRTRARTKLWNLRPLVSQDVMLAALESLGDKFFKDQILDPQMPDNDLKELLTRRYYEWKSEEEEKQKHREEEEVK